MYTAYYNVIDILMNPQKTPEKRNADDRLILKNLICKLNFFLHNGHSKEKLDLDEITNYIKYQCKEPGETLFR